MGKMLDDIDKCVGLKQSKRAVEEGRAKLAYVASDSEPDLRLPFVSLCEKKNVPIEYTDSMEQLGKACGIDVCCAFAVLLK